MIVRRFLLWARMVSAAERAEGVGSLARAYLYGGMSKEERVEAQSALTAMLDDTSPLVRKAMADALGSAMDTPRHLAVALANDQSDIASLVLARSPVLLDADLIDVLSMGDHVAQTAIAIRPGLSAFVSAALAKVGCVEALIALSDNTSATIPYNCFMTMIARYGESSTLRGALASREDLPIQARQSLTKALSESLGQFATSCGWLSSDRSERVTREAREKATITLANLHHEEAQEMVAHLRESQQLTPALILRALLSKNFAFVTNSFAELSGLPLTRVIGLMSDRGGAGFSALYRKTSLPTHLAPAFHAALAALHAMGWDQKRETHAFLSCELVQCVIEACEGLPIEEISKLMAMLRRFEAEASREDARHTAERMADEAALETLLDMEDEESLLDRVMSPEPEVDFAFDLSHLPQRTLPNGRKEPILMVA
jgi:uncharacterized protein (DUF2336 family)